MTSPRSRRDDRSQPGTDHPGPGHEKGQRLYCEKCRSEIEIINPCTCIPSTQVLRCCGRDMKPEIGVSVNLDD